MAKPTGQFNPNFLSSVPENSLKLCDLCGHLNHETNTACFVCGWSGRFERSLETIRAAVDLTGRRYGRLEMHHVMDLNTSRPHILPSKFAPLISIWNRIKRNLKQ